MWAGRRTCREWLILRFLLQFLLRRRILRSRYFIWLLWRPGPRYWRAWLVLLGRALLVGLRLLRAATQAVPERA